MSSVALKKFDVINFDKEVISHVETPSCLVETAFDSNFFSDFYVKIRKKNYTNRSVRKERISGGGRKPYKQKGTGNARCGSIRATGRRGGLTFGNINPFRSRAVVVKKEIFYGKNMLISHKFEQGAFFVLNNASLDFHSAKKALETFSKFGGKSFLVVHEDNISANTFLAVRNLRNIKYVNYSMLTINDIMSHDVVFFTVNALERFRSSILM